MLFNDEGQIIQPAEGNQQTEGPQDFEAVAKQQLAKARMTPVDSMPHSRPVSRLQQLQQFSRASGRSWQDNSIGQEEYYAGSENFPGGTQKYFKMDRTGEKGEVYTDGGYELPAEDSWETAPGHELGRLGHLGYRPFR